MSRANTFETPLLKKLSAIKSFVGRSGSNRPFSNKRSPEQPSTFSSRRLKSRSSGIQITRVGMWYAAACLVVGVAATNTGNNGLFLAVAMMLAAFGLAQILGWINVHRLELELDVHEEIFANRMTRFNVRLRNRSRLLPRWLLVISVQEDDMKTSGRARRHRTAPWLVPFLPADEQVEGRLEIIMRRRGPRRVQALQVSSLFPVGIFRKGRRYEQDFEVLVFPELFSSSGSRPEDVGDSGERSSLRAGQGHELYALRTYQSGDDPRSIHWKQSARQGSLIYQQRSREENRRLHIVFDNAVGPLETQEQETQFERLVSEAATCAVDHLNQGFEVALTTRDLRLGHASGLRQRLNILEALARIETTAENQTPLVDSDEKQGELRLVMKSGEISTPFTRGRGGKTSSFGKAGAA